LFNPRYEVSTICVNGWVSDASTATIANGIMTHPLTLVVLTSYLPYNVKSDFAC